MIHTSSAEAGRPQAVHAPPTPHPPRLLPITPATSLPRLCHTCLLLLLLLLPLTAARNSRRGSSGGSGSSSSQLGVGVSLPKYVHPASGPKELHRSNRTVAADSEVNLELEVGGEAVAYYCY